MSFFSSLAIFYPGRPPLPTVGELRRFCDELRAAFALRDVLLHVGLQYGANDPAAFDATQEVSWNESLTIGTLPLEEDREPEQWHHERTQLPWPQLWPESDNDARTIHRAYIHLGALTKDASRDLTAHNPDKARAFIAPDGLSVSINPAYAMTLGTEFPEDQDLCYGFLQLGFSGNGYFTWQPLEAYWQAVRHTTTLQTALRLCRENFPVPVREDLEPLKAALGSLFLNRDEYQTGDWIVSVSETG